MSDNTDFLFNKVSKDSLVGQNDHKIITLTANIKIELLVPLNIICVFQPVFGSN